MSSEVIIELKNIWKKYSKQHVLHNSLREQFMSLLTPRRPTRSLHESEFWALHDVSFDVYRGECLGLCGPNGSGKSTLLKLIANVTWPTRGNLDVKGRVAPLIELGAGMHPDLTGVENVYINGTILGLSIKDIKGKLSSIIDFSGLGDFIEVPVKKYSSGMYLRLAFSVAVHSSAPIFLLDEILAVGDEEFQKKCLRKIRELKAAEKTIIIISHDLEYMHRIADRIIFIEKGVVENEEGNKSIV